MLIINVINNMPVVKIFSSKTLKLICDYLNLLDWFNRYASQLDITVYQACLSAINGHLFEVVLQIFAFVFP